MRSFLVVLALLVATPAMPQVEAGGAIAKRNFAVSTNPLGAVTVAIVGASYGVTALALPIGFGAAITQNFTLGAGLMPIWLTNGYASAGGFGLSAGGSYYFSGTAFAGWSVGGGVSIVRIGLIGLADIVIGGGYGWVLSNGFTVSLGASLGLLSLAAGQFPLTINVPIGYAF